MINLCEICCQSEATNGVRGVKLCRDCFDKISQSEPALYAKFLTIADSKGAIAQEKVIESVSRLEMSKEEGRGNFSNPCEVCGQNPATTSVRDVKICKSCLESIQTSNDPDICEKFYRLDSERSLQNFQLTEKTKKAKTRWYSERSLQRKQNRENIKLQKIIQVVVLFFIILVIFLVLRGNKSEREARRLYEEAQSHFKNGEYEQTITNITKILELTNDGEATLTTSYSFYNGNIHYLRAQAYEAMGKLDDAIEDYTTATTRGAQFLSKSRPIPGAKAESFRTLSLFHNSLGIAYSKVGKFEDALAEFKKAIGAALGSESRIGSTELLLASLLEGEIGKRQAFTKIIGAYCYNIYLMEEKLGRSSNAKEIAEQLDYDKTMVVMLK